jgi:predicted DCC family thiol-disulfide oxidoreductase YuxK
MITTLFVLYDSHCGICTRLRTWIRHQPGHVAFDFVPAGSERARRLFPGLLHDDEPRELMVISNEGAVYIDDAAWLVCLWGLREYRSWSYRLARGPLRPFARAAWEFLSSNRKQLARMLSLNDDERLAQELARHPSECEMPQAPAP